MQHPRNDATGTRNDATGARNNATGALNNCATALKHGTPLRGLARTGRRGNDCSMDPSNPDKLSRRAALRTAAGSFALSALAFEPARAAAAPALSTSEGKP